MNGLARSARPPTPRFAGLVTKGALQPSRPRSRPALPPRLPAASCRRRPSAPSCHSSSCALSSVTLTNPPRLLLEPLARDLVASRALAHVLQTIQGGSHVGRFSQPPAGVRTHGVCGGGGGVSAHSVCVFGLIAEHDRWSVRCGASGVAASTTGAFTMRMYGSIERHRARIEHCRNLRHGRKRCARRRAHHQSRSVDARDGSWNVYDSAHPTRRVRPIHSE